MLRDIKGRLGPYTPNRRTIPTLRQNVYLRGAATLASVTVVPAATIAGSAALKTVQIVASGALSYADPHGRYDTDIDSAYTAFTQGIDYVATSRAVVAVVHTVNEVMNPDLTEPANNPVGYEGVPCDVERVEMFDAVEDRLGMVGSSIIDRFAVRDTPGCVSDDGMESVSLAQTLIRPGSAEGECRMVVKDGWGDEGWEFLESEDQCDEATEAFQLENLQGSLTGDGCGGGAAAASDLQHPNCPSTPLAFASSPSSSTVSELTEMDRLVLETHWKAHETQRTARGEQARALPDLIDNCGFRPSMKFMLVDMGAERVARETDLEGERAKYGMQREELLAVMSLKLAQVKGNGKMGAKHFRSGAFSASAAAATDSAEAEEEYVDAVAVAPGSHTVASPIPIPGARSSTSRTKAKATMPFDTLSSDDDEEEDDIPFFAPPRSVRQPGLVLPHDASVAPVPRPVSRDTHQPQPQRWKYNYDNEDSGSDEDDVLPSVAKTMSASFQENEMALKKKLSGAAEKLPVEGEDN